MIDKPTENNSSCKIPFSIYGNEFYNCQSGMEAVDTDNTEFSEFECQTDRGFQRCAKGITRNYILYLTVLVNNICDKQKEIF